MGKLRNAVNDARAIKEALEKQGVKVFYAENCTITDLEALKNKYMNSLQEGEVTFVFFAGHGVEFANANRLIAISEPSATHCNYANESLDLSALLNGYVASLMSYIVCICYMS